MPPHYSSGSFFRQAPRELLARYFESRGLSFQPHLVAVADTRPDPLYAAWLQFPEQQRNEMDLDFREIFKMSCRKGVQAIIDEAQSRGDDSPERASAFVESLSTMPDHFHRAMATWLDHGECWREANRFYGGDAPGWWRKRKNMGHRPAATDPASLRRLADLIGTWFQRNEGRGSHCVVESFHRDELDFYFAYPEDYSRLKMEWRDGEFIGRRRRPAFEVVFVYSQQEGSMDLSFPGPYRALEPLQEMFATAILETGPAGIRYWGTAGYTTSTRCAGGTSSSCTLPAEDSAIKAVAVRLLRIGPRRIQKRISGSQSKPDDSMPPGCDPRLSWRSWPSVFDPCTLSTASPGRNWWLSGSGGWGGPRPGGCRSRLTSSCLLLARLR